MVTISFFYSTMKLFFTNMSLLIASDGKVSEDLLVTLLNGFDHLSPILGPRLGLAPEDYRHRIEMICAECVRVNANMDWYSYVAKKAYIQA